MSNFAEQTVRTALEQLQERRTRLQAFIDEAADLDVAIREQEGALERYMRKRPATAAALAIATDEATQRRLEAIAGGQPPAEHRPPARQPRREGPTNKEKALAALRENPRGLSTTAVQHAADIPAGSVSVVLSQLEGDGRITKVGRGFWKPIEESAVA